MDDDALDLDLLKSTPIEKLGKRLDGRTKLHWSASKGKLDALQFLLDMRSDDINGKDDLGWTPLMSAVSAGHVECVKALLAKGADPGIPNKNGQICLHYHKCRSNILKIMIPCTVKVNHRDKWGNSPLARAVSMGKVEAVALMLESAKKFNVNVKDYEGNTPLHIASEIAHDDMIRLLLEHGADKTNTNKEGQTPSQLFPKRLSNTLLGIGKPPEEKNDIGIARARRTEGGSSKVAGDSV
eukprot:g4775.t1